MIVTKTNINVNKICKNIFQTDIFDCKKKGDKTLKICKEKVETIMAKECILTKELCEKANINQITFRRIMTGKNNPRPVTVGRIAKALNVNVVDIIKGGDQ